MKKSLIYLLSVLFWGCISSSDSPPKMVGFDEAKNMVNYQNGNSRLVARDFVFQGKSVRYSIPSLAYYEIKGDTVINEVAGKFVAVTYWEFTPDTTLELHYHQLLVFKDSLVMVYNIKGANPAPIIYGLLKPSSLDTNFFLDQDIKLRFPLTVGMQWKMRLADDPWYAEELQKKYLGMDTLSFGRTPYVCAKFEHSFLGGAVGHSWVSALGLTKAEIDYGESEYTNPETQGIEVSRTTESYRLILVNPSSRALTDAKADAKKRYAKTSN